MFRGLLLVPVPIQISDSASLFGKGLLYTKGGADPTFASAKVKNAIGRIGIFFYDILGYAKLHF